MQLFIKNMNEEFATEILNWKYPAPYDLYNNELNPDNLKEMLEDSYSIIVDENDRLVGFFCIGKSAIVPIGTEFGAYAEDLIDIGLGMKPELTGQGHGFNFFSFILENVQENYKDVSLRLTVAQFNHRAIRLYEKFRFVKIMEFSKGDIIFQTMVKKYGRR